MSVVRDDGDLRLGCRKPPTIWPRTATNSPDSSVYYGYGCSTRNAGRIGPTFMRKPPSRPEEVEYGQLGAAVRPTTRSTAQRQKRRSRRPKHRTDRRRRLASIASRG